jgi:hypothetical protein
MVSPVRHPVTPNQAENVAAENQTKRVPQEATQKQSAKPQPAQDSVKLSRTAKRESSGTQK